MKSSKLRKLKAVEPGDVVLALDGAGRDKLLLVYKTTRSTIFARHVTSQAKIKFGRDGHSKNIKRGGRATIVSTRPLPPREYSIVRGLERKTRLGQAPDGFLLTKDEMRVILKSGDYFKARPLVDGEEPMESPKGQSQPRSTDGDARRQRPPPPSRPFLRSVRTSPRRLTPPTAERRDTSPRRRRRGGPDC